MHIGPHKYARSRTIFDFMTELKFQKKSNAISRRPIGRDSHVRKNFLARSSNDLKFSDLVEKISEIISISVSKFYDDHKRR